MLKPQARLLPIVCKPDDWPNVAYDSSNFIIRIGIITLVCPSICPISVRKPIKPAAALVKDLKRCGLLEDTLVVWGGEFGRTNYCQGKIQKKFGRDHHPRCFRIWLAGGGVKAGSVYGETDEFGYNLASGGIHIHDLHATILHLLGVDHELLTYKFQGRRYRLTDVYGKVVREILA
jgi:hypothetical protein